MSNWIKRIKQKLVGFLKKEDGGYLLLENGYKIIISETDWDDREKISTTWTKR